METINLLTELFISIDLYKRTKRMHRPGPLHLSELSYFLEETKKMYLTLPIVEATQSPDFLADLLFNKFISVEMFKYQSEPLDSVRGFFFKNILIDAIPVYLGDAHLTRYITMPKLSDYLNESPDSDLNLSDIKRALLIHISKCDIEDNESFNTHTVDDFFTTMYSMAAVSFTDSIINLKDLYYKSTYEQPEDIKNTYWEHADKDIFSYLYDMKYSPDFYNEDFIDALSASYTGYALGGRYRFGRFQMYKDFLRFLLEKFDELFYLLNSKIVVNAANIYREYGGWNYLFMKFLDWIVPQWKEKFKSKEEDYKQILLRKTDGLTSAILKLVKDTCESDARNNYRCPPAYLNWVITMNKLRHHKYVTFITDKVRVGDFEIDVWKIWLSREHDDFCNQAPQVNGSPSMQQRLVDIFKAHYSEEVMDIKPSKELSKSVLIKLTETFTKALKDNDITNAFPDDINQGKLLLDELIGTINKLQSINYNLNNILCDRDDYAVFERTLALANPVNMWEAYPSFTNYLFKLNESGTSIYAGLSFLHEAYKFATYEIFHPRWNPLLDTNGEDDGVGADTTNVINAVHSADDCAFTFRVQSNNHDRTDDPFVITTSPF